MIEDTDKNYVYINIKIRIVRYGFDTGAIAIDVMKSVESSTFDYTVKAASMGSVSAGGQYNYPHENTLTERQI